MYTLDQMCLLCNKKDSVNNIEKDVVIYIDKLKFVFPDLLVLDDIERQYIKFLCTSCKDTLKQIYIFKLQCKNALLIRRAYFNPNLPFGDEFKFDIDTSFNGEDNPDIFAIDSYKTTPLPFEINFKEPEDEIVESTDINNIPTVPLPFEIHFKEPNDEVDTLVDSNNINVEPTVTELCTAEIKDENNEPGEDFMDHLFIEPEGSEEPEKNSVSVVFNTIQQTKRVNAVERLYPDPPIGSYQPGYYPGKPRPRSIKPFTALQDEPVITVTNGGKIVETSTYLADHSAKMFMCKRCNKQFSNARTLSVHMIRHTGKKRYKCPFCEKQHFTLSEHNSHLILHTSDHPFQCKICCKEFKERTRLKMHMMCHTRERKYVCDICGKDFIYHSNLSNHKLLHSDERKYCCQICSKTFRLQSTLKVHMDAHNNRKFQCDICSKTFQTYAGYYRHKIKHNKPPSLKCEYCKKEFYFQSVLNLHVKTHTKEKSYLCKICSKCFATNHSLKVHLVTHSGDKPHRCEECGRSFSQSGSLTVHMRLHNGDRPYKCQICPIKSFIKSHHYENHMKKVHGAQIIATGSKKPRPRKTRTKLATKEITQNKNKLESELDMQLDISPRIEQIVESIEEKEQIEFEDETDDATKSEDIDIDENGLVIDLEEVIEQKTLIIPFTDSSNKRASPVLQQTTMEPVLTTVVPTEARKAVMPIQILSSEVITTNESIRILTTNKANY